MERTEEITARLNEDSTITSVPASSAMQHHHHHHDHHHHQQQQQSSGKLETATHSHSKSSHSHDGDVPDSGATHRHTKGVTNISLTIAGDVELNKVVL